MPITGLSNKISTMFSTFSTVFKSVGKQADHKRLTNYIIAIHQKEATEEILNEFSNCLKNILNYRLFGFVMQQKNNLDIWLDPSIYKDKDIAVVYFADCACMMLGIGVGADEQAYKFYNEAMEELGISANEMLEIIVEFSENMQKVEELLHLV